MRLATLSSLAFLILCTTLHAADAPPPAKPVSPAGEWVVIADAAYYAVEPDGFELPLLVRADQVRPHPGEADAPHVVQAAAPPPSSAASSAWRPTSLVGGCGSRVARDGAGGGAAGGASSSSGSRARTRCCSCVSGSPGSIPSSAENRRRIRW